MRPFTSHDCEPSRAALRRAFAVSAIAVMSACSNSMPPGDSNRTSSGSIAAGAAGTGGNVASGGAAVGVPGEGSGEQTNIGALGRVGASTPAPGVPDVATEPKLDPVASHGALQVVGTELRDAAGHPVQLRGVSSQWLNYETKPFPESKAAIGYVRDHWKLSLIRAAMGTDAAGGLLGTGTGANADAATMQTKVDTIVQNAIDLGIYVIVDWHTSNAVTANGTQVAQASAFFSDLASRYGSYPNIIYEPYNEPNRVTWAQIKPYHEAVVAAIRAVDPDNLIVLGTPTFSQDVDLAARDPVLGTNLLYTLHFYACTHKQALRDKAESALALGIGLFVTEFGSTPADGGVVSRGDPFVCEGETQTWFSWMADHHISGAAWKLDQCTDTSCILSPDAPVDGPWTDDVLSSDASSTPFDGGVEPLVGGGHGQFVASWIRE
jgi:endoglucanase